MNEETRINRVESYALRVPVEIRLSSGEVKETNHLIVEVQADDGVVGFGEGTPYLTDIYNACALAKKTSKRLVGLRLRNARDELLQVQKKTMEKTLFDYGPFLALDTAIIDALCKSNDVTFPEMLGGTYRDRVPVSGTVFLDTPKGMARTAKNWVLKGIGHLKVKVVGNSMVDATNLKAIRDVVGYNVLIRIDANQAYRTVDKAVDELGKLERYDVAIVEQPIRWDDIDGLRRLRGLVGPKVMVDESLRKPSDVKLIAEREAADIINFHPSKLGCLTVTREAIEKAVDLGLEYMIGSAVMTGIGVAAHLHLAASMRELHYPNEEIGLYEMFGRDIVTNPLRIVDGYMEAPKNHGVGVEIDENMLKKYSFNINFLKTLLASTVHWAYSRSPSLIKSLMRRASSIARKQ